MTGDSKATRLILSPAGVCLTLIFFSQAVFLFSPLVQLALSNPLTQAKGARATPIFIEAADRAGLDFRHYNGANGRFFLPEIMGGGAALFDYDNDGDLDVFLVQGSVFDSSTKPADTLFAWRGADSPRSRLYRNDPVTNKNGGLDFKLTDVTDKSGITASGYGMGVACADINNDGWTDLYICNLGANQMWVNNRDGTFTERGRATATDARWSTSAAFFDYDRDGWLDLFVVGYVIFSTATSPACYSGSTEKDYCMPRAYPAAGNRLFHNRGDGSFEDVTAKSGVSREFGRGLGVVTADFDGDGWIDLYVANDGDPNQLWMNQKNGTFKNEALLAGAAVNRDGMAEAGMGVDAADFDGDGDDDIFITHLMEETNTLFVNMGKGLFEDRTRETGHGLQAQRYTGFGTLFFDYDNDGWLDLFVTNGAVRILQELSRRRDPYPFSQPNQLFHNTGKGNFVDSSPDAGEEFNLPLVGRGAAFGDIDNDGDTDIVVANNNGRARLYLNQIGNRNNWIGLRLVDNKSGRDMLGARVEIIPVKGAAIWRRARTDGSYLSAQDPRVLAGLGSSEKVDMVRVHWPGGRIEEWKNLPVNRYITLREGSSPQVK